MQLRRSPCRALVVLGLSACAPSTRLDAPPARVSLRFAWAEGERAVDVRVRRTRESGDRRVVDDAAGSYVVRVERDGGSVSVVTDRAAMTTPPDVTPGLVARLAIGAWPAFAVDRKGRFIGLADPAAVQADVDGLLAEIPEPMRTELAQELVPDALGRGAGLEWDALVGRWAGRVFEVGVPTGTVGAETIEAFGDLEVGTVRNDAVVGFEPCGEARCVRLRSEERLDAPSIARVSDALRTASDAQLAEAGVGAATEVVGVEWTVAYELVVDPATLEPWVVTAERRLRADLAVAGRPVGLGQIDTWIREYRPIAPE